MDDEDDASIGPEGKSFAMQPGKSMRLIARSADIDVRISFSDGTTIDFPLRRNSTATLTVGSENSAHVECLPPTVFDADIGS